MRAKEAWDSLKQGILICNQKGQILYFNDLYEQYLGVSLAEAKGNKITRFRATSVVPEVIKSGTPREGMRKAEGGRHYYASVYPIFEDGKVSGSISIVTSVGQHHGEEDSSLSLEERVRQFEREEILLCCEKHGMDTAGKKAAAKELGISLATLYNKLKADDYGNEKYEDVKYRDEKRSRR